MYVLFLFPAFFPASFRFFADIRTVECREIIKRVFPHQIRLLLTLTLCLVGRKEEGRKGPGPASSLSSRRRAERTLAEKDQPQGAEDFKKDFHCTLSLHVSRAFVKDRCLFCFLWPSVSEFSFLSFFSGWKRHKSVPPPLFYSDCRFVARSSCAQAFVPEF